MAVYRKKLVDKDGNTIIPAIGDIYGQVYTAILSSASGGIATYTFTPDTPVENNRVYAVKFPVPTVDNATIILGDGVVYGSILVPPVAATDSPNYESLTTNMINDTEPLLLMYNGVQWVCLNQKKTLSTADLDDGAVTTDKVDWTTFNTNEHVVGYYNNQPIYEKMIEYTLPTSMTNPATINIPHGIPNLGYMLDIAMTIVLPDGRSLMATKGIGDNVIDYLATLSLWVINSGNIVFKQQGMNDTIQGRPCIITMKYTKK